MNTKDLDQWLVSGIMRRLEGHGPWKYIRIDELPGHPSTRVVVAQREEGGSWYCFAREQLEGRPEWLLDLAADHLVCSSRPSSF